MGGDCGPNGFSNKSRRSVLPVIPGNQRSYTGLSPHCVPNGLPHHGTPRLRGASPIGESSGSWGGSKVRLFEAERRALPDGRAPPMRVVPALDVAEDLQLRRELIAAIVRRCGCATETIIAVVEAYPESG